MNDLVRQEGMDDWWSKLDQAAKELVRPTDRISLWAWVAERCRVAVFRNRRTGVEI